MALLACKDLNQYEFWMLTVLHSRYDLKNNDNMKKDSADT